MIINIERINRLHNLIRHASTGNPHQLAEKLSVSEATVYRDIKRMRRAGAPIVFNPQRQSSVYEKSVNLRILIFEEVI